MSDVARIGQPEIQPLPRWARLAFAARCVRRATRLLRAPAAQAALLDSALARVEQAAATAHTDDDLADAAASAYTLALDNLDGRGRTPTGSVPAEDVLVTCMVAHATAFAAEAATLSDAQRTAQLVAQSVDFAIHAFRVARSAESAQALAAMRADLERLRERGEREGWGDATAVPPQMLGAL
jgi:hypothetical protein